MFGFGPRLRHLEMPLAMAATIGLVVVASVGLHVPNPFQKGAIEEPAPAYPSPPVVWVPIDGNATVVFTFDDGFRSQLGAARILEEHGYRGTFYVTSGYLRNGTSFVDYLSPEEVTLLAEHRQEVASHAVHHTDLTSLSPEAMREELARSQAMLRDITGEPVRHFAYPYGGLNADVQREAMTLYASARGADDEGRLPLEAFIFAPAAEERGNLPSVVLRAQTSLDRAKAYLDAADASHDAVILAFHGFSDDPVAYQWSLEQFEALVLHARSLHARVVTMDGLFAGDGADPFPR